jgi:hypothetical protein
MTFYIDEITDKIKDPESKMIVKKILEMIQNKDVIDILIPAIMRAERDSDSPYVKRIFDSLTIFTINVDACLVKTDKTFKF